MNILKKSKYENTPHLEKDFFITEQYMGDVPGDGYELISSTDYAGPYKTLEKAKKMFVKLVKKDKFLNDYDFMIRGPLHTIERRPNYTHKTIWYNPEIK